jgi:hypothetical protein
MEIHLMEISSKKIFQSAQLAQLIEAHFFHQQIYWLWRDSSEPANDLSFHI